MEDYESNRSGRYSNLSNSFGRIKELFRYTLSLHPGTLGEMQPPLRITAENGLRSGLRIPRRAADPRRMLVPVLVGSQTIGASPKPFAYRCGSLAAESIS